MPKTSNGGGQNQSPLEQNRTRSQKYLARFSIFTKNHKFLCIFITLYCVFLVAFSRYAPNLDDLHYFSSIYQNEINFFTSGGGYPRSGRFYPFAFLDLLILMKISTSPYLFFGFNALLFALFCAIYIKILELSNGKSTLNSVILALLATSSGFVTVFFGICYPEKVQIIWIALFMLFSLRTLQNPTHKNQLFGIIFLNIALYYKEPSFVAAFAFGVVLLIYALQNRQKDLAKYALYILLSALIYALLYVLLVVVFNNVREYYYQESFVFARELIRFALNDSLIAFGVGGIALWRICCVAIKKARIEPFFDALLCASLAYLSVFIALKMYNPYYLLPCFVFGIPSLLYFSRKYFHNLFIKICIILGLFGFALQNLPSGIYKMIDLKAQGVQFERSVDFVASYLSANPNAHIYFAGIGRGKQLYGYDAQIYSFYLIDFAIDTHDMDMNVWDILRTNSPHSNKNDRFEVIYDAPKMCDLIIVSNKGAFGDSLRVAGANGELVFKSGFHTIPYVALLPLAQYISAKYFGTNLKNTNFFRMPTETFIFKVR